MEFKILSNILGLTNTRTNFTLLKMRLSKLMRDNNVRPKVMFSISKNC
jgi:hypothetical protein